MSCAPGLLNLISYATSRYGQGVYLGCVGDDSHDYGYHLPPSRIRNMGTWGSDYSTQLPRDRSPAADHSAAFDFGMSWARSREWLAWLITQLRSGRYPDVCEVIGSLDGRTALYWRAPGWATQRYTGSGHVAWSHIAVWRDATARDHTPILRDWVLGTLPPQPPTTPPAGETSGSGTEWIFDMAGWKDETVGAPPPAWMGGPREKMRIGDWYGAIPGKLTQIHDNLSGAQQAIANLTSLVSQLASQLNQIGQRLAALEQRPSGTGGSAPAPTSAETAREIGRRLIREE